MPLSEGQRAKDRQEDLKAVKEATELLKQAHELMTKAKRKLKYNKQAGWIDLDIGRLLSDTKDCIEKLEDVN